MQDAPSEKRNTAPTERSARTGKAALISVAALAVGVAAAGATASETNGAARTSPTLAELLQDGFTISAMSQGPIGGAVSIAVQRETTAFLCAVERGAEDASSAEGCQLLSGAAYLAAWRETQASAALVAERAAHADLIAAMDEALFDSDRQCAFDLTQVIDEAVWGFESRGGDPTGAAEKVKGWLLGRKDLLPLGDPSENILQWTTKGLCRDGQADERLSEIRATRRSEAIVREVFSEFEGCVGVEGDLTAAFEAKAATLDDPKALKQASRRMFARGAVREDSAAGPQHFRLTKGCP